MGIRQEIGAVVLGKVDSSQLTYEIYPTALVGTTLTAGNVAYTFKAAAATEIQMIAANGVNGGLSPFWIYGIALHTPSAINVAYVARAGTFNGGGVFMTPKIYGVWTFITIIDGQVAAQFSPVPGKCVAGVRIQGDLASAAAGGETATCHLLVYY